MKARIQKWGNSLALRIPKALAEEAHVRQNTQVEISLVNGKIVVEPVKPPAWTLEDLLEGITEENLHLEVESGPSVGKEVW
ncbi:MAG: AbrB/MazE/SpoVT family DNA-binding domain-containing protein [Chloroflexi bacterium]|nr:AbrB/MazE/SpoVT family DNA-binding domain-containing protein [Chloroflexota bacterium]